MSWLTDSCCLPQLLRQLSKLVVHIQTRAKIIKNYARESAMSVSIILIHAGTDHESHNRFVRLYATTINKLNRETRLVGDFFFHVGENFSFPVSRLCLKFHYFSFSVVKSLRTSWDVVSSRWEKKALLSTHCVHYFWIWAWDVES